MDVYGLNTITSCSNQATNTKDKTRQRWWRRLGAKFYCRFVVNETKHSFFFSRSPRPTHHHRNSLEYFSKMSSFISLHENECYTCCFSYVAKFLCAKITFRPTFTCYAMLIK